MSSLTQIRESLATVQSYKLPERYAHAIENGNKENDHENEHESNSESRTQPLLDPDTIQRYRNARSKYIKSQITDLILEHLKTLRYDHHEENNENDDGGDGSNSNRNGNSKPMIQFPESMTEDEHNLLRQNMETAKENLCRSVSQVKQSYEGVYSKYNALNEKRRELEGIVEELEKKDANSNANGRNGMDMDMDMDVDIDIDGDTGNHNDSDDILDQTELELQDEKLNILMEKRSRLEAKLRKVRMETEKVSSQIGSKKDLLRQMASMNGGDESGSNASSSGGDSAIDVDNLDVEVMKAETEEIRLQTQKLKDMSEFYESIKSATEVISGIKILSVTDASATNFKDTATGSATGRLDMDMNMNMEGAFSLKVQLLNQHIVEIIMKDNSKSHGLSPGINTNCSTTGESFRVLSARLVTNSVLTDTLEGSGSDSGSEDLNNPTPTVSITIPPLDDLVSLAANLEPGQDLRFVLRESLARVRTLSARMNELAYLRTKYLTKITNPAKNKVLYGFGGEDQEILCSLDSQITVVIRLTANCPILKGSAYIQRIVGCGGWESAVLQKIKSKVNEHRPSGPVDLMETLVDEIARVVKEDNIKIPGTPNALPRRRKER